MAEQGSGRPVTAFLIELGTNDVLRSQWSSADDDGLRRILADHGVSDARDQDALVQARRTWNLSVVRYMVDREAGADEQAVGVIHVALIPDAAGS